MDYNVSPAEGILAGLGIGTMVISLIIMVLMLIGWWKIFTKAGETGIFAIIPIVNFFFMCKIVWGNPLYGLIMLVPFVNGVFAIITNYKLAERFGKGMGFGLGLIFLPFIFIPMLGFSDDQYIGIQ